MPSIIVNGIETDQISVLDRGFQYGDGLFETILITGGLPQFWNEHINRLAAGCERLNLPCPNRSVLQEEALSLCKDGKEAVLKIIISRGSGGRGYAITGDMEITRVLALFPLPEYSQECWRKGVTVRVCDTRLGTNPALAGIKHLNRLEQVLARSEWDNPEIREGLMLDRENNVIEGTMTNLFYVKDNEILTPSLSLCGVKGIIRDQIIILAKQEGISVKEKQISLESLYSADEIFLTNSVIRIWPVHKLENREFRIGAVSLRLMERLKKESMGL